MRFEFWVCRTFILLLALFAVSPSFAQDDEGQVVAQTTDQFQMLEPAAEEKLAKTAFFSQLQPFGLTARQATAADIKMKPDVPNLGRGDPKAQYDVILQPGHFGRTSGATGGEGRQVSEQELVAYIVAHAATYLIDQKLKVLVVSADDFDKSGLVTQVFLAVHADASDKPCKTGPSLGYAKDSSLLGMHTIGFALAASMGQSYTDFMKDNFTVNEHQYYAFRYMKAAGYSGLLEVGELTCPSVENTLIRNALLVGKNLGVALKASVDILKEPLTPK